MEAGRRQILLAQHVVQDDAAAGQELAAALAVGQAHGRHVAGGIDHRDMGGPARRWGMGQDFAPVILQQAGVEQPVGGGRFVGLAQGLFQADLAPGLVGQVLDPAQQLCAAPAEGKRPTS